jgi:hypothetical protein
MKRRSMSRSISKIEPYLLSDIARVKYILYDASGAVVSVGDATAVADGQYQVDADRGGNEKTLPLAQPGSKWQWFRFLWRSHRSHRLILWQFRRI